VEECKIVMLTFEQFLAKHATKYAGLSDTEKRTRYADYKSTFSAGNGKARTKNVRKVSKAVVRPVRRSQPVEVPFLSPCAMRYLKALNDPFGDFTELPCIPDMIALPSHKFSTIARGVFTVGTGGVGYISVAPNTCASDLIYGFTTVGTFTQNTYQEIAVGVQSFSNDSPFLATDLLGCDSRLVGCGVRVSYYGPELTRSGVVVLHRATDGVQIPIGSTTTTLLQTRATAQAMATRKYESVNYRPDDQNDLSYGPAEAQDARTLLIVVSGATPGISWSFEVISHYELIGNRASKSQSHADPIGMGAAISATPLVNPMVEPAQQFMASLDSALNFIAESTSGVWRSAAPYVYAAAGNMAGKYVYSRASPGLGMQQRQQQLEL